MRTNKKSDENFEILRNAINEAILKNKKVAKVLEKIKEDNMLSDLCNYELILKLRKIVKRFQQNKRVKIKPSII